MSSDFAHTLMCGHTGGESMPYKFEKLEVWHLADPTLLREAYRFSEKLFAKLHSAPHFRENVECVKNRDPMRLILNLPSNAIPSDERGRRSAVCRRRSAVCRRWSLVKEHHEHKRCHPRR